MTLEVITVWVCVSSRSYTCSYMHTCHRIHVEIRGQLLGFGSSVGSGDVWCLDDNAPPPKAHIFECLCSSLWKHLGKGSRCGFVGESLSPGVDFDSCAISQLALFLPHVCGSRCEVSASALYQLCLPACCHVSYLDGRGL